MLVTSVEGLRAACAELKKQREIAVDVEASIDLLILFDNFSALVNMFVLPVKMEMFIVIDILQHHSMFSYLGLTCLVQVSSRTTDYIIDPFDMWEHMHLLNDVFSDPNIVKVYCASS